MTKMKIGGVILTGFGAWLLVSKGMNVLHGMARDVEDAIKWRAYYKYGGKDTIPPGYSQTIRYSDGKENIVKPIEPKTDTATEASKEALKASVSKVINDTFDRVKATEEPLEGQTEAYKGKDLASSEAERNPEYTTVLDSEKTDYIPTESVSTDSFTAENQNNNDIHVTLD